MLTWSSSLAFPVSEIAITKCFVPPGLVGKMCEPPTTVEQDAIKGKWVRVDRDLNKEVGVWSLVSREIGCECGSR